MEQQKRENGFYWVKLNNRWFVAEYIGDTYWAVPAIDATYFDSDFEEIDERKIERL